MIEFVRFLVPFLAPLPIGVVCIFLALFFLLFRLRKLATFSLLITLCLFLVLGYGLPARQQLEELERRYPPLDIEKIAETEQRQIRFVVVLGSSNTTDPALPESNQLDTASLYRLVEGIRLQRQLPQTFLILSGGANQDPRANAAVAGRVAESLGMDSGRLVIEERPHDTAEEAKNVAAYAQRYALYFSDLCCAYGTSYEIVQRGWYASSCGTNRLSYQR